MEMEISIAISILTWIPWENLKSTPRSVILRDFQNQEYRFTILKSRQLQAEKKEKGDEEEHRQSQSVVSRKRIKSKISSVYLL